MGLGRRMLRKLGLAMLRSSAKNNVRAYAGAQMGRLYGSWLTGASSADAEIKSSLKALRARARQLARDTAYGSRFLHLCAANIIGPEGFRLRPRILDSDQKRDKKAIAAVKSAWNRWAESKWASLDHSMTWLDQEMMFAHSQPQDGETITRMHELVPGNPFGLSLQWIEADHLGEDYNARLGNGNRVIMSIEYDPSNRPVRYHLLKEHPGTSADVYRHGQRVVVPAEQILHSFRRFRASQSRGVPWMHPVMTNMHQRAGYQEAALVNARAGACKTGFLTTPFDEDRGADEQDSQGSDIQTLEPLSVEKLAYGEEFKGWDPTYPSGEYGTFLDDQDHEIAAGFNVSHAGLTGNLTKVNYSSARQGALEMRDTWRVLQKFTASRLHDRVFPVWLKNALALGAIEGYTILDFDYLNHAVWGFRGWAWVDPLKEINASILAIKSGQSSISRELAKLGLDRDEVFEELADDMAAAKAVSLELLFDSPGVTINETN